MLQTAHDLGNLITVSNGHRELAEFHAGKVQEHLTQARLADERCMAILQAKPCVDGYFDLNAIATELAQLLESGMLGASIMLSLELKAHKLTVAGDPMAMFRALLNLCINAKNAMASGGKLSLETAEDEAAHGLKFAIIRIQDTGAGMSPEFLSRIWDHNLTSGGQHGHGLRIVKDTIDALGGHIDVMSDEKIGTLFTIRLPKVVAGSVL